VSLSAGVALEDLLGRRLRGPELLTAECARVGAWRPHAAGTKVTRGVLHERHVIC
jgi:hypothetical protein